MSNETTKTMSLELSQQFIEIGSRGQSVKLDCFALSPDVLRQLLIHGAIQKVGDAASAAKAQAIALHFGETAPNKADAQAWIESPAGEKKLGEVTLGMMAKAIDALLEGKWAIRDGSGVKTRRTDEESIALDMAKETLKGIFGKACAAKAIKATMENFVALGEAVAKYFEKGEKAKAYTWKDESVIAWIDAQLAGGKADYRKAAQEEIARRASLANDVNLNDILGDI